MSFAYLKGLIQEPSSITFGGIANSPYILPFVAALVGILLIILIVIVTVQYMGNQPRAFTRGPLELWEPQSPVLINRDAMTNNTRGSYTVAFYVRIDAVPDPRSLSPLIIWPGAWRLDYNSAHQELVTTAQLTPLSSTAPKPETTHVPDLPMQKWTQIVISWEGRTANFYLNGALAKSWTLANVPPSTAASLTIVPHSLRGQVAYIQLWNRRLTSSEIAANYTSTSDSNGRPDLGPGFFKPIEGIQLPALFCASGNCAGAPQPSAAASQTWEFPYA